MHSHTPQILTHNPHPPCTLSHSHTSPPIMHTLTLTHTPHSPCTLSHTPQVLRDKLQYYKRREDYKSSKDPISFVRVSQVTVSIQVIIQPWYLEMLYTSILSVLTVFGWSASVYPEPQNALTYLVVWPKIAWGNCFNTSTMVAVNTTLLHTFNSALRPVLFTNLPGPSHEFSSS